MNGEGNVMSFNVLIVDDSNAMRTVIKKIVTISGFQMNQCLEAGNGILGFIYDIVQTGMPANGIPV